MTWSDATDAGRSVTLVRWCRSRPSVFFVLDSDSFLYIWDLNMDQSSALKSQRITQQSRSVSCIVSCTSSDVNKDSSHKDFLRTCAFSDGVTT